MAGSNVSLCAAHQIKAYAMQPKYPSASNGTACKPFTTQYASAEMAALNILDIKKSEWIASLRDSAYDIKMLTVCSLFVGAFFVVRLKHRRKCHY